MFPTRASTASAVLAGVLASVSLSAQASKDSCASGKPPTVAAGGSAASVAQFKLDFKFDFDLPESLNMVAMGNDGLTLFCLREDQPHRAKQIGTVNGLVTDTALIGIDFRVQDGKLYGVGNAGGVYSINTSNAVPTLVNRLSVPLAGSRFGVDFNPAADRLRIVSDTGQNLRHNVNAGGITLVDGVLNTGVVTPPATVAPTVAGVVAAAYTNNDDIVIVPAAADTATTLFVVNGTTDQVMLQSPPNAGVVAATGKLGADGTAAIGFDIYSIVRKGITVRNLAFATLVPSDASDGRTGLYSVNLLTGKLSLSGRFASGVNVSDIAIPLYQD